ncbi:hypothetical protein HYE82_36125, partial [Streptomyces sp. BR123]|nr:hypothetical protein [Streptomyces sp. BR123]
MTTQPSGTPPSERPTGPPAGPLADPRGREGPPTVIDTPAGTGAGGTGADGTGGGGPGGGGRRGGSGGGGGEPPAPPPGRGEPPAPWWRSVPRLVTAAVAVAAVVALAVVLTRPSGSPQAGGELFLESAAAQGQDPYTASTVTEPVPPAATTPPP